MDIGWQSRSRWINNCLIVEAKGERLIIGVDVDEGEGGDVCVHYEGEWILFVFMSEIEIER